MSRVQETAWPLDAAPRWSPPRCWPSALPAPALAQGTPAPGSTPLGRLGRPEPRRPRRRGAGQSRQHQPDRQGGAIRIARTDPKVAEERRRYGPLTRTAQAKPGTWQVDFYAGRDGSRAGGRRRRDRPGARVVDRLPDRLADGARLPGPVRPQAQRPLRLAAAGAIFLARALRLPPPAADRAPRPAGPAQLRDLGDLLQRRQHRRQRAARLSAARLSARADALDRLSRRRRRASPVGARSPGWRSAALPARLSDRAQHRRLGRHRRRLRRGDRRRPHHPRPDRLGATFPSDNPSATPTARSTTTPTSPSSSLLPWSGTWDDLPAAHAAAIFFDLATVAGLFVLGRRLRPGPRALASASILGFAWAAYPFTDYALQSNSNDTLIAALLVWALVLFALAGRRGALLPWRRSPKFAPLALAPLFATRSTRPLDAPRTRAGR